MTNWGLGSKPKLKTRYIRKKKMFEFEYYFWNKNGKPATCHYLELFFYKTRKEGEEEIGKNFLKMYKQWNKSCFDNPYYEKRIEI